MADITESREMNLKEYTGRLPYSHRANRELNELRKTIGLFNSMIESGERHTDQTRETYIKALDILNGKV